MTISLAGHVAVITGGGSGIGQGLALALARLEMKVIICGRRGNKLTETIAAIEKENGIAMSLEADVSIESNARHVVETAINLFSRLDVLINNAAVAVGAPLHELKIDDWDTTMAVNLRGPFLMTRFALPYMRNQKYGQIINISSESGLEYYPGDVAYGTSKHALNAFGEYVQRENQDFNIRVNTICPGMVVTEMTEDEPGLHHEKCLYPEDIADLVIWLLTRRENIKIGRPVLIQTMLNPWE